MALTPKRDYIDDFRNDGGVTPKQSLSASVTNVHKPLALTCLVCGYAWSPVVRQGSDPDKYARCPNCNFRHSTGL
jgi:hypothetical protein